MQKAYSAYQVFTGQQWLQDHSIIVKNGIVEAVVPITQLPEDIEHISFPNHYLVPAFIDIQVYGAAKKLLAVFPEADTLQLMYEQFAKQGTVLFQPTVATNTIDVFKKCIDAVRAYWGKKGKGVHGLHLEGPWLNAEKRGAHLKEWIHSPSIEEVKELLDYGKDVITMITLAPEVCNEEVLRLIESNNIIISAGHSNATYTQATNSFTKGVSVVTHLYNAMSALHHREPGLVGAVLNHSDVRGSVIPDGYHVDYVALALAKKLMGSRLFAITDAVTDTETGPYQHQLAGDKYECNGTLSGSALSMHQAFYNLVHHAGIEVDEALRMCSLYPAEVLKIDQQHGKIAPHYLAQFVVIDRQLQLTDVVVSE